MIRIVQLYFFVVIACFCSVFSGEDAWAGQTELPVYQAPVSDAPVRRRVFGFSPLKLLKASCPLCSAQTYG